MIIRKVVMVCVVASLMGVWFSWQVAKETGGEEGERTELVEVEAVEWDEEEESRWWQRDTPVIYKNHPWVLESAAWKDWTDTELNRRLPLLSVYTSKATSGRFTTFHDSKPMERLLKTSGWTDFNTLSITPFETLWLPFSSPSTPWRYFSRSLHRLPEEPSSKTPASLWLSDISPLLRFAGNRSGLQSNLWLGRAGLVTAGHYDTGHNAYVQLRGYKDWLLAAPGAHARLYPALHPHYLHSQLQPSLAAIQPRIPPAPEPLLSAVGLTGHEKIYRVRTCPASVLVVPPYWLHEVTTVENSVAVNVWTDSEAYLVLDRVYHLPLPFEPHWSSSEMATAISDFFLHLTLPSLNLSTSSTSVASALFRLFLLEDRYAHLFDRPFSDLAPPSPEEDARWQALCSNGVHPQIHDRVSQGIEPIAQLFRQITPLTVRLLSLFNYLEHTVDILLGVKAVYPFLRHCL